MSMSNTVSISSHAIHQAYRAMSELRDTMLANDVHSLTIDPVTGGDIVSDEPTFIITAINGQSVDSYSGESVVYMALLANANRLLNYGLLYPDGSTLLRFPDDMNDIIAQISSAYRKEA